MEIAPDPASEPDTGIDALGAPPKLPHGESVGEEEANRLAGLATEIRDQDDLQRDVFRQADHQLTEQANERDLNRLEKTKAEKTYVIA